MNFELPDITNALELNNTLSSYVIITSREKNHCNLTFYFYVRKLGQIKNTS